MQNHQVVFSVAISIASVLLSLWALLIARSSLKQAESVAERDHRDWRQRKWFDLYLKANEAYDLLEMFQRQHGSAPHTNWQQVEMEQWNNVVRHIREAHAMATVFPKNAAVDALFECTNLEYPADALSSGRLQRILDSLENLRKGALVDVSVLES